MKPARYIFVNRGLGMSPGKIAAQAAHSETLAMVDYFSAAMIDPHEEGIGADIELYDWFSKQNDLFEKWYGDGHYAKYVMKCDDTEQMFTTERYLQDRGFKTYLVIDEGHTEGTYMVPTAMSVELVDKDDQRIASIFSTFRMYREARPHVLPTPVVDDGSGRIIPTLRRLFEKHGSSK